jgi:hypothetical protein
MLMEMTHKGKGPEIYEKETSGSHGGNRYHQNIFPIIILREAMEGEHHMDR